MKPKSTGEKSRRIVGLAALIFVAALTGVQSIAAPLEADFSGIINYGAYFGQTLNISLIYDSDAVFHQLGNNGVQALFAPENAMFNFTIAGGTHQPPSMMSLTLYQDYLETGGPNGPIYGDYAGFYAEGRTPDGIFSAIYGRVMYPSGSFTSGLLLPAFAPSYSFLSFNVGGAEGFFSSGVGPGISDIPILPPPVDPPPPPPPFTGVPEPSTYGVMGSLVLMGLVIARKSRSALRRVFAAAA